MQTSDWSIRPLSSDQLHYAAADAYALLLILAVLTDPHTKHHLASAQARLFTCATAIQETVLGSTQRIAGDSKPYIFDLGIKTE